ncbi:MAG: magnesium transporter [Tepidanaerobacteraceae bacterium]|nr:magnesium transporter [Tepidanaerobacteraceae bacterium]
MLPKKDVVLIKHLIINKKADEAQKILAKLHPADIAQILGEIKNGNKRLFFHLMSSSKAAEVLEEFDPFERLNMIKEMTESELIAILENMSVDEIIDLFQQMPTTQADSLLLKLPKEDYEELKSLLKMAEDTAGGLMTTDYVYILSDVTVNQAIADVRMFGQKAETIYYIYVVDDMKHLQGVLSLRELISAPRDKKIFEIMHKKIVSVDVEQDQEEVAKIILRYSLLAIPVVNKENRLLGIVTIDDAIEILEEEDTEDIHKMAGITPEQDAVLTTTIWGASKKRLFWLVICLLGDMIAGKVIDNYSHALESVVSLAFFIPVLMATGGNIGTQSLALSVRGMATEELGRKNTIQFIIGETLAGLQLGIICGAITSAIAFLWQKDVELSMALGLSMCISLMLAALIGVLVPMILHLLNIDPAVASGPFITTLIDISTLVIYFTFAFYFIDIISPDMIGTISFRLGVL